MGKKGDCEVSCSLLPKDKEIAKEKGGPLGQKTQDEGAENRRTGRKGGGGGENPKEGKTHERGVEPKQEQPEKKKGGFEKRGEKAKRKKKKIIRQQRGAPSG